MKYLRTAVTLATAFGIILVAIGSLGSVLAQTSNATGGNTTGATQNTTGNQSDTGTASGITNLTGTNTESLLNNTEVSDPTTGLQDL